MMRELIFDGTAFHAPANCNTLPHTLPAPAPQDTAHPIGTPTQRQPEAAEVTKGAHSLMRELIFDGTAFHAPANCNTLPHPPHRPRPVTSPHAPLPRR